MKPHPPGSGAGYPWRLCLFRFFARLFIAVAIYIGVIIAVVVSALPYGGASPALLDAWKASHLLFLWALFALVPPKGLWEQLTGERRRAAYLAIFLLFLALGAGVFTLARRGPVELQRQSASRESGIRLCSADLHQIIGPVAVESLLIESGRVEERKLAELLGSRGLKFVELRARAGQDWRTKQKTYGVDAFNGDSTMHFGVAPGVKIVRVGLARKGDAACTKQDIWGSRDFTGRPPIAPDACLRVDFEEQSRASHALRALPAEGHPGFIKWSLVEQASGKVFAGLTSSDDALHPSMQGGGGEAEQKAIADDIVHCRSPHFSLMNLVYGPARKPDERLSLGEQLVTLDIEAAEPDNTGSWEALDVPEQAVSDWSRGESARHGPAWKDAFRIAQQSGWAGYADGVIDFKAGVVAAPRLRARPGLRAEMRGSNQGFMAAWSSGPNNLALAQFGTDGRLLWKRQIVSSLPVQDPRARFDLMGMEWDAGEVRLYGFRRITAGKEVDVRVLMVPLSPRDGLPVGASLSRQRPVKAAIGTAPPGK